MHGGWQRRRRKYVSLDWFDCDLWRNQISCWFRTLNHLIPTWSPNLFGLWWYYILLIFVHHKNRESVTEHPDLSRRNEVSKSNGGGDYIDFFCFLWRVNITVEEGKYGSTTQEITLSPSYFFLELRRLRYSTSFEACAWLIKFSRAMCCLSLPLYGGQVNWHAWLLCYFASCESKMDNKSIIFIHFYKNIKFWIIWRRLRNATRGIFPRAREFQALRHVTLN